MAGLPTEFLEALASALGSEFVSTAPADLERLSRTTLPQGTTPVAWVRPANRQEVQAVVRAASAHRIPIYTISTGKNWGYGEACAPTSGCLLLDLARMNRIIEVNSELAYAVVEPGVTQGQLAAYLQEHHLPLMMDCTGAGPDASYLGNTAERGFGHSPYGDRFLHSCNYEAVLPDGSFLTTGLGVYPGARAQHLYKWGVGPSLDGLFTQSNFAILTRMTVWLMPKPQAVSYYFIGLSQPEGMAELAHRLRPLYLTGSLRNTLHCANDMRLMASSIRFPWDKADGRGALDKAHPEIFQHLSKQLNLLAWSCAGVMMGTTEEVAAAKQAMRRALRGMEGIDKLFFLSNPLYELSQWLRAILPGAFNALKRDLLKVRWMVELLRGQPSYQFLTGAHWRGRREPDAKQDPLDSGSGLIWMGPLLPMTREAVGNVERLCQSHFHEFGFEYQATYSFVNPRTLCAIISISFDRDSEEETRRASACADRLLAALIQAGYIPYRGSAIIQKALERQAPDYWASIGRLQQAWDLNGILSPGHYSPLRR